MVQEQPNRWTRHRFNGNIKHDLEFLVSDRLWERFPATRMMEKFNTPWAPSISPMDRHAFFQNTSYIAIISAFSAMYGVPIQRKAIAHVAVGGNVAEGYTTSILSCTNSDFTLTETIRITDKDYSFADAALLPSFKHSLWAHCNKVGLFRQKYRSLSDQRNEQGRMNITRCDTFWFYPPKFILRWAIYGSPFRMPI